MKFIVFILLVSITATAQQTDISEYFKKIEAGEASTIWKEVADLKAKKPNDPNVLYLSALLTEDASEAVNLYSDIYNSHPKNQFADDALFNIFSYYYAIGLYKRADGFLKLLQENYSSSPLINLAKGDYSNENDFKPAVEEEAPDSDLPQYNYTIQAGAFLNNDNAKNLSSQFEADGYFAKVYPKSVGGSILNVVIVGQFETESDASPVLDFISKNYNLKGRVVPLSQ